jgi:hypothetical protein
MVTERALIADVEVAGLQSDHRTLRILQHLICPFAPSDFNCLNFKLPVEHNSQAQPLEDVCL